MPNWFWIIIAIAVFLIILVLNAIRHHSAESNSVEYAMADSLEYSDLVARLSKVFPTSNKDELLLLAQEIFSQFYNTRKGNGVWG